MTKQVLNVGVSNNDKTGDTLRAGGLKIKANFEELYNALANDGMNISGGNVLKTGNYDDLNGKPQFSNVAITGNFFDLENRPTVGIFVGSPPNAQGVPGHVTGNIAFDSLHQNFYICTEDYIVQPVVQNLILNNESNGGYTFNIQYVSGFDAILTQWDAGQTAAINPTVDTNWRQITSMAKVGNEVVITYDGALISNTSQLQVRLNQPDIWQTIPISQLYETGKVFGDGDVLQIKDVPATLTSPGNPGDIAYDTNYFYICIGYDTWKRVSYNSAGSFDQSLNTTDIVKFDRVQIGPGGFDVDPVIETAVNANNATAIDLTLRAGALGDTKGKVVLSTGPNSLVLDDNGWVRVPNSIVPQDPLFGLALYGEGFDEPSAFIQLPSNSRAAEGSAVLIGNYNAPVQIITSDINNVNTWTFASNSSLTLPNGAKIQDGLDDGLTLFGPRLADFVTLPPDNTGWNSISNGVSINVERPIGSDNTKEYNWTFAWDGSLYAPTNTDSLFAQGGMIEWRQAYGRIGHDWDPNNIDLNNITPNGLRIQTTDVSSHIRLSSNYKDWIFGTDGSLTLPDNTQMLNSDGLFVISQTNGAIVAAGEGQFVKIDPTEGFQVQTKSETVIPGQTVTGEDSQGATSSDFISVWIEGSGGIDYPEITAVQPGWTVTGPGLTNDVVTNVETITYAPGMSVYKITTTTTSDKNGYTYTFTGPSTNGINTNVWSFDNNGALTFPDATVQTTAYTASDISDILISSYLPSGNGSLGINRVGNVVELQFTPAETFALSAVPATSLGQSGDTAGMIAADGTHLYYCRQNYSGGVIDIPYTNASQMSYAPDYIQADIPDTTHINDVLQVTNVNVNGVFGQTVRVTSIELVSGNTYKFYLDAADGTWYFMQNSALQSIGVHIWKRVAWSNDTW